MGSWNGRHRSADVPRLRRLSERLPWWWHRRLDGTRWCRCSRSESLAELRREETGYIPRHVEYGLWQVAKPHDDTAPRR